MIRFLAILFVSAALAAVLQAAPARADDAVTARSGGVELQDATETLQSGIVPMRVAYDAVRRAYPGAEILNGQLVNGQRPVYIIRILTRDGRRIDVRVDARTGRVI